MRIIKNKNGTYCTDCKQSNKCICVPNDEMIELEYRMIIKRTDKAILFLLKKQKLSTGKIIKTNTDIWFPIHLIFLGYSSLQKVKVIGYLVNKIT